MLIFSLLNSIAAGFKTLLDDIDLTVQRAKAASQTIVLQSGDTSKTTRHLHTATPDCPGRLDIDLEPDEWSSIVKRTVRKYAFKQNNGMLTLEQLLEAVEDRQRAWHLCHDPTHEHDPLQEETQLTPESQWTCLRLSRGIRQILEQM